MSLTFRIWAPWLRFSQPDVCTPVWSGSQRSQEVGKVDDPPRGRAMADAEMTSSFQGQWAMPVGRQCLLDIKWPGLVVCFWMCPWLLLVSFFHTYFQAQLSDLSTGSVSYPVPFSKILVYLSWHKWILFLAAKNPDGYRRRTIKTDPCPLGAHTQWFQGSLCTWGKTGHFWSIS